MQLCYLQMPTEIAGDKSSWIDFPLPMAVIGPVLVAAKTLTA